jgi:hypothetical protein
MHLHGCATRSAHVCVDVLLLIHKGIYLYCLCQALQGAGDSDGCVEVLKSMKDHSGVCIHRCIIVLPYVVTI